MRGRIRSESVRNFPVFKVARAIDVAASEAHDRNDVDALRNTGWHEGRALLHYSDALRTIRTEHRAWRATNSATLPKRNFRSPF